MAIGLLPISPKPCLTTVVNGLLKDQHREPHGEIRCQDGGSSPISGEPMDVAKFPVGTRASDPVIDNTPANREQEWGRGKLIVGGENKKGLDPIMITTYYKNSLPAFRRGNTPTSKKRERGSNGKREGMIMSSNKKACLLH